MKRDELRAKLARTDASVLATFLAELAEEDTSLQERIEALALREEPSAYATALERRLRRLRDGRSFIAYRESSSFAHELEAWLDDLENGLLGTDPAGAWRLIDEFIRADGDMLDRADDSDGLIGDAYRRGSLEQLGLRPRTVRETSVLCRASNPGTATRHCREMHVGHCRGRRLRSSPDR